MENKNNQVATNDAPIDKDLLEKLILNNDLAGLSSEQRVTFYSGVCKSLGLNPLTQPFGLISFEGKVTMYAKRDATDQLRKIHRINIVDMQTKTEQGLLIVTVKGCDQSGRYDISTGIVPLKAKKKIWDPQSKGGRGGYVELDQVIDLEGKDLANAIMKAETKAKRRLTLSLVGLGITDESELETMQGVKVGTFEEPPAATIPAEDETIDEGILDHWNQALNECKTAEDVDLLALNNKEIVGPSPTLRKMFMTRKNQIKKPDAKEKARQATDFVNSALKK